MLYHVLCNGNTTKSVAHERFNVIVPPHVIRQRVAIVERGRAARNVALVWPSVQMYMFVCGKGIVSLEGITTPWDVTYVWTIIGMSPSVFNEVLAPCKSSTTALKVTHEWHLVCVRSLMVNEIVALFKCLRAPANVARVAVRRA